MTCATIQATLLLNSIRGASCSSLCLVRFPSLRQSATKHMMRNHRSSSTSSTSQGVSSQRIVSQAVLRQTKIPVDEDGIPLTPPYSVKKLFADLPAPKVSDEQFIHLHKLAALLPPEIGSEDFKKKKRALEEMVRLVEGVKARPSSFESPAIAPSDGSTVQQQDSMFYIPDGRIWPEGEGIQLDEQAILNPIKRTRPSAPTKNSPKVDTKENKMLNLAPDHVAGYYVVKRPLKAAVDVE